MLNGKRVVLAFCAAALAFAPVAKAEDAPLKALLIAGGCCHDYAAQKGLLKEGIESRANIKVDVIYTDDTSTAPPISIYGNADYAKGYDVVIHDECAADINDPETVKKVLAPHVAGIPGVNLHCAMHSYRTAAKEKLNKPLTPGTDESLWFDYLGVHSSGHGPQKPIAIKVVDGNCPIVPGLDNWTTGNEELYNNIEVREGVKVVARGSQEPNKKPNYTEAAVAWFNAYGENKTPVFSTTLAHNNETVSDPRYLDMVTKAVLVVCGKAPELK